MNLNPIPNMSLKDAPKPGPLTPIGKFRSSLNAYKGRKDVPAEVRELYEFYLGLKTKEIDQLRELKNLSNIIKTNAVAIIFDKMIAGEELSKRDIELLKLFKDTNVESYKLEHGDKHVIEHKVTAVDIRNAIFAGKKVIDVEAIKEEVPVKPEDPKEELISIKKILIVGYPKVGKTNFSEKFKNVIHTDSYMKLDFEKQIYQILEDIKDKDEWIIEGMQGIRLFRKMLQLNQS